MVKFQAGMSVLMLAACAAVPAAETYIEAENFKGNAYIAEDKDASGGKILAGKTWYVFVQNVKFPQEMGDRVYCMVRARSSDKANWYLAYESTKPFGWFSTPGENKWVWINIGRFSTRENNGIMPKICLQNGANGPTSGAVDAIYFSSTPDVTEAEKAFAARKNAQKEQTPAAKQQ